MVVPSLNSLIYSSSISLFFCANPFCFVKNFTYSSNSCLYSTALLRSIFSLSYNLFISIDFSSSKEKIFSCSFFNTKIFSLITSSFLFFCKFLYYFCAIRRLSLKLSKISSSSVTRSFWILSPNSSISLLIPSLY